MTEAELLPGLHGAPSDQICPMCYGSHGCDLPPGHAGAHQCHHEEPGKSPKVFSWSPGADLEFDWRTS